MALNIQEMKLVIKKAFHLQTEKNLHVPLCFWGPSGVGKTAAIEQAAKELTQDLGKPVSYVIFKPAQADSTGDLTGMPETVSYYDCPWCPEEALVQGELAYVVRHSVQEHAKKAEEARDHLQVYGAVRRVQGFAITRAWPLKGPVLVCLDELNRAGPDIRNALFGLLSERVFELTGYRLPKDAIIIATANPSTGAYTDVHELDGAMVKRLVHFTIQPDAEEWLDYVAAQPESQDPAGRKALDFFTANKSLLMEKPEPNPVLENLQPSNRTSQHLVRLSLVLSGKFLKEAAIGCLGTKAGAAFAEFMRKQEEWVRAKDILASYPTVQANVLAMVKDGRQDLFQHTQGDIGTHLQAHSKPLSPKEVRNLVAFLKDLKKDQLCSLLHLLLKMDQEAEKDAPIQRHVAALHGDAELKKLLNEYRQSVDAFAVAA